MLPKSSFMSRLPLLREPCDIFVSDFPYDCSGIVGGYGIRRLCLYCIRLACDFCINYWETNRNKSAPRLRGDCTFLVQFQWIHRTVAFATRSLRGIRKMPVWGACNAKTMYLQATGLRCFLICITFLYQLVYALEPVNSYDNSTAVATSAQRPYVKNIFKF